MYLAFARRGNTLHYEIRKSHFDPVSHHYSPRLVFDLGTTPNEHFELMDGIPLFSFGLQEAITQNGSANTNAELERLLFRFFPKECQDKISRFAREPYRKPRPLNNEEQSEIKRTVHLFDRRRLYYLYYGAVDQSRLYRMHEKLCRPLLYCSRDEREYHFLKLEQELSPAEYHNYVFAIFNLQHHFENSFAIFLPEALSHEEIGDAFIEEICRLNESELFWLGEPHDQSLHTHLRRYLIMFFDFAPQRRFIENDFIRNFINSHRTFRWPEKKPDLSDAEIHGLFSISFAELKKMSKQELTRTYRKKAMELHPDQGGDQERFVELTNIYKMLLNKKSRKYH